jgi:pimeloyl-ACP methyl ester carboxylesterase
MPASSKPLAANPHQPRAPAPLLVAGQPWWEALPADFPAQVDHFELHGMERLQTQAAYALDATVRTGVALATAALAVPLSVRPTVLLRDRKERQFYKDLATLGDADRFFVRPPAGVPVRCQPAGPLAHQPAEGESLLLSFDSPFEAVNPRLRAGYARHERNQTAWAQYWRHGDRPRPTICLVHGYVFDSYRVNSRFFDMPWFFDQGYDVLLYTLPFHGYRQGLLSPFSGHGYFAHGPLHINEVVAHAVHDFRIFMDWLFAEGAPAVGVTGLSLGGYTTSLLASADERLAFAIPVIPPASLVDVAYQWFPLGPLLRSMLWSAGIDIRESRHTMAVGSPLTWQPRLPAERLMIVAGMGDGITYPKHARLLQEHWQGAAMHWFPGGHLAHFGQPAYLEKMRQFMAGIGFLP